MGLTGDVIDLEQFHKFLEFFGSIAQSVVTPNDDWSPILSDNHGKLLDGSLCC